jgi:hypothetical protein
MEKSMASESASVSAPGWVWETLDFISKQHGKNRSEFFRAAIPAKLLTLKRKRAKLDMLRAFVGTRPSQEKRTLTFEVPADIAEIFENHCEDFGCGWNDLFIIGAVSHILNNAHAARVMDYEHARMAEGETGFDGIIS